MTRTRARRSVLGATLALCIGLLLAACGSGDGSGASGSGGDGDDGGTPQLTVAVAVPNPLYALPYVAQFKGYFREQGVDVRLIDNTGSNTANALASGQADVAQYAAGVPLVLAQQGKPTTIIYAFAGNVSGGTLVGARDVTSIDQLRGQRIAVLAKGSATYGWANLWSDKFGLDADLVPFQDNASIQSALASGRVAAAGGPYANFAALLDTGRANMLIDSRDPAQRSRYAGAAAETPEGVIFGLTSTMEEKRDAIVRFLRALEQARTYVDQTSDEQLARDLRTFSAFQATPLDVLTDTVRNSRAFYNPANSYITEEQWEAALGLYGLWGLDGFDPGDPRFAYENLVDMAYYDAAGGRPQTSR